MGIDWGDYELLPPDVLLKPRDISREEAWRRHRLRMRLRPERLDALERLARTNGLLVGARGDRDCGAVEDWVFDVVVDRFPLDDLASRSRALLDELSSLSPEEAGARYPDTRAALASIGYRPGRHPMYDPEEPVLSLVHDTAMLCGDELTARFPTLSWTLKRGSPRNVVYHHTVQVGYTRAARGYSAEPVFSYMQQLAGELRGDPRRRRWPAILAQAEQYA